MTRDAAVTAMTQALEAGEVEYLHDGAGEFAVQLPGTRRLKTACLLTVGEHAVRIEAFVVRKPDENAAGVHSYLLQRNAKMYAVSWSIDATGDIYLTGRLPLDAVTDAEVDRVLGAVLEYADGTFNTLLEMGFGGSIRREWAWRVKNGESLANLAAFAEFVERTTTRSAQG
ncbi:MAG: YbjN domain-containing protein [Jatrophihabitans sp.]